MPYTREKWEILLGTYSAVADVPAVAFVKDLLERYPDTKVVLVDRGIERYKSLNEGVIEYVWSPAHRIISRLDSRFVSKLGAMAGRWTEGWMEAEERRA